ncbi:MAG: hypothetical protein JEZ07_19415 [Phycisphaerae bacterium]|nr:hypothetical protein [Phycisphaerae bacterium]
MNKVLFSLVLLCVVNISAFAGSHAKVFLIGGQSNAAGSGGLQDSYPAIYQQPQSDIFFWTGGRLATDGELDYSSWDRDADSTFRLLQPGSGNYVDGSASGCELSLGRALADMFPEETIVIIKYGMSGSALQRGLRNEGAGDWCPDVDQTGTFEGSRYRIFKNSAVLPGLQAIEAANFTYEIAGMCWIQGETDAGNSAAANAYQVNLENFISKVRLDFNCPDMAFFTAKMNAGVRTYADVVNLAMDNVAAADEKVYSIYVGDVSFNTDNIHYNATGQVEIGLRFAQAYWDHEVGLNCEALGNFNDVSNFADAENIVFDNYVPDDAADNGVNLNNVGTFTGFVDGINGQESVGILVDGSDGKVVFADYSSAAITSDIAAGKWGNAIYPDSGQSITFSFVDPADISVKMPVSRVGFKLVAVGQGDDVRAKFLDEQGRLIYTSGILSDGNFGYRCVNVEDNEVNAIFQVVLAGAAGQLWTTGHVGDNSTVDFSFGRVKCSQYLKSDLNFDCDVNLLDLAIMANEWMQSTKL